MQVFARAGRCFILLAACLTILALPVAHAAELGTLKHYNGDVPKQEADFKKAIASRVCDVGGHAVVATRTEKGEYQTASVIKYAKGYHP